MNLAIEPVNLSFGMKQENDLIAELARVDRSTSTMPVGSVREVEMQADGTIGQSGLKPTTWCFYQLCSLVCPGLYSVLVEMTANGDELSRLAAISVYNQLLRLRFTQVVHSKVFLCDRDQKTVEALVSQEYHFMPNMRLCNRVQEFLANADGEIRFYGSDLRGRWLVLRYYAVQPLFQTEWDGFNYHAGWHFSNHEGGRAAVRLTNSIVRGKGLLSMLLPLDRSRYTMHRGKNIERKIDLILGNVAAHTWRVDQLQERLQNAATLKLGLGNMDAKVEEARKLHLEQRLRDIGRILTKPLASKIVAGTIVQPYNENKARPMIGVHRHDMASRTLLDLAASASRESRGRDIAMQELLEQLAYRLVFGKAGAKFRD
jgi:hypothetical protein